MPDQYTHTFEVYVNGSHVAGEAEFNTDGEWSIKPEEWSQPFTDVTYEFMNDLFDMIRELHNSKPGTGVEIKKIVIEEKV